MPPKPEKYVVESLLDVKMEGKKKVWYVKWKGYGTKHNTWEPTANLKGFEDEMEELEKSNEAPKKQPKRAAAPEELKDAPAKKAKKEAPKIDVVALATQLKAELMKKVGKAKASAAKPEKAEKPKKEKKASEVVEVDKILAVKANAKGTLVYQILWMDSTKTWEPEDNVMDDDLVDEFEAAEQAKAYSEDDIKVGSEVEVKAVADGFENSWSAATVSKQQKGHKFLVEFTGFVNDDGEHETESVPRDRLRLVPEDAPKGWAPIVGEIIEVNEDDCWWEARVLSMAGKKLEVMYRTSDEKKSVTLSKKVRPCSWLKMG